MLFVFLLPLMLVNKDYQYLNVKLVQVVMKKIVTYNTIMIKGPPDPHAMNHRPVKNQYNCSNVILSTDRQTNKQTNKH